jgi:predicted nucleotidyltransferase/DNA-binding XRE family transcriptional regulator
VTNAAEIVREARRRAGLTQSQLARTAGLTQSVVSAYESGRREPSLQQLNRLVSASGQRLQVTVEPRSPRLAEVRAHGAELSAALARLGAHRIRVFGSVARGTDLPSSDVDLLVDLDDGVGLFAVAEMKHEAERILSGPVDIVPSSGLKPDVAESVNADAVPL